MVELTSPEVYIEEIPSGFKSITGVPTSITAFLGRTSKGPSNSAVEIFSSSEFEEIFGGKHKKSDLAANVKQFFNNGGEQAYIVRLVTKDSRKTSFVLMNRSKTSVLLASAKDEGEWGNKIFLEVNNKTDNPKETFNMKISYNGTEEIFENISMKFFSKQYALRIVNERSKLIDLNIVEHGLRAAYDTDYIVKSYRNGSDGSILVPQDYFGDKINKTGFYSLDKIDLFNLMVIPYDEEVDFSKIWGPASRYCKKKRAFLIIDSPVKEWTENNYPKIVQNINLVEDIRNRVEKDSSAIFYPRIQYTEDGEKKYTGPSALIAGLMSRVDSARGVWKAPAGEEAELRGLSGLEVILTDIQNGILNRKAVNCLRRFPRGYRNWGARTLDGSDQSVSEWKYIPVRRTAFYIEESIYRGTKWVVFEPNGESLWAKIRISVGDFMMRLFRDGAFQGKKPEESFFVKCDSETTSQKDISEGIVNITVGFAPLKPAEFVIIKISQIVERR